MVVACTRRPRTVRREMTIEHHVADGFAALVINGAAPVVVAYEPIARLALARIVRA